MSDSFYREFEDKHRGSRELIKSRLRVYLSFITPLQTLKTPVIALDLGCGRGEWLELLKENGINAYGVDMDAGMLSACQERGLRAELKDALGALREAPPESISIVSAFHVVEHIPFDELRMLAREALRVLKPGGLLILETPNPENLVVGSNSFYQDPSHTRPLPPELLNFVVEHAGYERTKIIRLQESPELHASTKVRLINVLNGVSQDYSIVAQKAAPADILSAFDQPFGTEYGVSLTSVAERYEAQTESRFAVILNSMAQSEARTAQKHKQMSSQLAALDERLARVEAHLAQSEARVEQANAHAAQLMMQLHNVLQSRSWRITAPWRYAGGVVHRLRSAIREDRLASGSKRRIKSGVRRVAHFLLTRPKLKGASLWILDRIPNAKLRLRSLMQAQIDEPAREPGELSPRALQIYVEFKKALEARKN